MWIIDFQTTVGQILCKQELVKFGKEEIIYICFSQNGSGQGLKDWVGKSDHVTFLNRTHACEFYGLEDDGDNIKLMENIISKVQPHVALFFDEVPFANKQ